MNKRFLNKSAFDPGRFRYPLTFLKQGATIASDGSQTVSYTPIITLRAVREQVSRRVGLSLEGYLKLVADASELTGAWVFTIRRNSTFQPTKDMIILCDGLAYTPRIIQEVDEPAYFTKMLCVNTDITVTT